MTSETTATRAICNLCHSPNHHTKFYKPPYTRVQCDNCELVWSLEQPDDSQLEEMYHARYFQGDTYLDYAKDQPIIELNAARQLRALNAFVQPPGVVIDVGCATGFFLNVCRKAGWTVKGVELSDYASAYARDQLGLDVTTGILEEGTFAAESADLVTLWDVIEHVPDPMEVLRLSARCLKPGGVLVISTGDIDSLISRFMGRSWRLMTYDHLYYFSTKTLAKYLDLTGLEIVKMTHSGRVVSSSLMMHMLLNHYVKVRLARAPLTALARFLPNLPINLFDVMTMTARKKSTA